MRGIFFHCIITVYCGPGQNIVSQIQHPTLVLAMGVACSQLELKHLLYDISELLSLHCCIRGYLLSIIIIINNILSIITHYV
jgi:hypothetical protein